MREPEIAERIAADFATFQAEFRRLTERAPGRFLRREWQAAHQDAMERLLLYPKLVARSVQAVQAAAGGAAAPRSGAALKASFAASVSGRPDAELAETYYNSVIRRVLHVVGIDAHAEFTAADGQHPAPAVALPCELDAGGLSADLFRRMLETVGPRGRWADLAGDAELCARALARQLRAAEVEPRGIDRVEMLPFPFYRNKGAYLVGRLMRGGEMAAPLVVALLSEPEGLRVDALLTTSDEVSVVFGFTRSYFQVEAERPRTVVDFLAGLMPLKRLDELYTAIGYNKHGKTRALRAPCSAPPAGPSSRLRARGGQPGAGDERLHPALLQRGLQGDQGLLRLRRRGPAGAR